MVPAAPVAWGRPLLEAPVGAEGVLEADPVPAAAEVELPAGTETTGAEGLPGATGEALGRGTGVTEAKHVST